MSRNIKKKSIGKKASNINKKIFGKNSSVKEKDKKKEKEDVEKKKSNVKKKPIIKSAKDLAIESLIRRAISSGKRLFIVYEDKFSKKSKRYVNPSAIEDGILWTKDPIRQFKILNIELMLVEGESEIYKHIKNKITL